MPSTTLELAIGVKLRATAAITSYTSSRIYWLSAPDDATTPYIVYRVVAQNNLEEAIGGNTDSEATVQIDVWDVNQYNALSISRALISTLEGFSGGFDTVNILECTTTGPQQLRDPDFNNMYHFIVDANIKYYRS